MKARKKVHDYVTKLPRGLEAERILLLGEAADMLHISTKTLRRLYPQFIVQVTPRTFGVKVKHIVAIGKGKHIKSARDAKE